MLSLNSFSREKKMHNGFIVDNSIRTGEMTEGSEVKFFITVNGDKFLVKDSSFNSRRKQNSLAPYCEYVGSNFIRLSGLVDCQHCYLGKYQNRDVVICEDLFSGKEFRPFRDLHQSSAGTDLGSKYYTYSDVLYVLDTKNKLDGFELGSFKHQFWLMFLFDAILGNRDRHEGNWGFIKKDGVTEMAPIFDNGSSLFPDVDLQNWNDYDFIRTRVYKMPGSQFKMWKPDIEDRPMRTNFWEIICEFSSEFSVELQQIRQLDFNNIMLAALADVPLFCYDWLKTISKFRFECLIQNRDFDLVWEDYENDWNGEY